MILLEIIGKPLHRYTATALFLNFIMKKICDFDVIFFKIEKIKKR